jgi:hypothetical protein
MAHEYKTLYSTGDPELLDMLVNTFMQNGWDLWGNPYVLVYPSSDVRIYHQVMVKFDPEPEHSDIKVTGTALQNPAGFTVQVPETPDWRDQDDARETDGGATPPIIRRAEPLLDGMFCSCQEPGDNTDCPVHFGNSGMAS